MSPELREGAARICDETARWERGERGPLRTPANSLMPEGTDEAFGIAALAGAAAGEAMVGARMGFKASLAWSSAAVLLRAGWSPGEPVKALAVGQSVPS